jgi:ArsR family transcriptional regulator, arsenate/arsenite/antimonite-responsive transcriptional repressor
MKDIVRIFKTLSDPTRLRIMMLLLQRELCVCELMFVLKQEQSRVSHHLRILRDSGLVEDVREGKWIIYKIPGKVRRSLEPLFEEVLKEKWKRSKELDRDSGRLAVCLREEIRKQRR